MVLRVRQKQSMNSNHSAILPLTGKRQKQHLLIALSLPIDELQNQQLVTQGLSYDGIQQSYSKKPEQACLQMDAK
jgi:hypothetical protein